MSRVVVLGAGIAGHTAAAFARRWLGRGDTVTVVSPRPDYNWVPSNIWVGVGLMKPAKVTFPLAPVYERAGIEFVQAAARELHPEGDSDTPSPYVIAESADGTRSKVRYDFLINATGPALRFDKTEGLGPDSGNSLSVCLPQHAAQAAAALDEEVERMRRGENRRFLVGVGHGTCTCEGAAFEYIVNLEFELRHRGVRDRAEITWITNEYELGDFGMGGMHLKRAGYVNRSGRRRAHPGASHTTGRAGPHPAVRVASRKRRYGSANPCRPRSAQYALGRARARTGELEMRQ